MMIVAVCCLLFAVCGLLSVGWCLLFVGGLFVCCFLFDGCWWLLCVVHYSSAAVYCLLFLCVCRCLKFIVCCLLLAGYCYMLFLAC